MLAYILSLYLIPLTITGLLSIYLTHRDLKRGIDFTLNSLVFILFITFAPIANIVFLLVIIKEMANDSNTVLIKAKKWPGH